MGVRDHRYGHGIIYIETKKKTNRRGERLLAFLKRQANVIGLYIYPKIGYATERNTLLELEEMDSVKDGEA